MIASGELLQDVRDPIFTSFDFPDSIWGPVPGGLQPSSIIGMIATEPHAETAYSDQQVCAMRKSAEAFQRGPGELRVERATRHRPPMRFDKGPPWTRIRHTDSAGSGFSEPLHLVPANPYGQHPPVLQHPPSDPKPDLEWWQGA